MKDNGTYENSRKFIFRKYSNGIHHSNYGFDKIINLTRFNNQYGIPTVWINIDDSESSDLYSHLQKLQHLFMTVLKMEIKF